MSGLQCRRSSTVNPSQIQKSGYSRIGSRSLLGSSPSSALSMVAPFEELLDRLEHAARYSPDNFLGLMVKHQIRGFQDETKGDGCYGKGGTQ